jgi:hypothetical protein
VKEAVAFWRAFWQCTVTIYCRNALDQEATFQFTW